MKSSTGHWSVTPHHRQGDKSKTGASPTLAPGNQLHSLCDFTSVAEDGEIVDLHPDAQDGDFDEEVTLKSSEEVVQLQKEVLEMEKRLQVKKLQALKRRKEQLERELREQDDSDGDPAPHKRKSTGDSGRGGRINVNYKSNEHDDEWEGLMGEGANCDMYSKGKLPPFGSH